MLIIDLKNNIMRNYIRFLLEEVSVVPQKDYTLKILNDTMHFMLGEEKKVPRIIARILEKHGIVELSDEEKDKAVLSRLLNLLQKASFPYIEKISPVYIEHLMEVLSKGGEEIRQKFSDKFSMFIESRATKVFHRFNTEELEGLDIIEETILAMLIDIKKKYKKILKEEGIDIVSRLVREIEKLGT